MLILIDDLILQVVLIMRSVCGAATFCFELAFSRLGGDVDLGVVKWVDK